MTENLEEVHMVIVSKNPKPLPDGLDDGSTPESVIEASCIGALATYAGISFRAARRRIRSGKEYQVEYSTEGPKLVGRLFRRVTKTALADHGAAGLKAAPRASGHALAESVTDKPPGFFQETP